jgi:SAM-dependent methyltransferase
MPTPPKPSPIASTVAFFDSFAEDYDAFYANRGWWAETELAEILPRFQLRTTDRIADIGCGTGRLLPLLISQAAHVYACDLSENSIAIVQAKCQRAPWGNKVTPIVASMTDRLDIPAGSLDAIFNMQAYMCVPAEGRREALREAARLLKPGGRLLIQVYAYPTWILDPGTPQERIGANGAYYRCFARDDLRDELVAGGWEVKGLYPIVRWPQLRRLGRIGKRLELLLQRLPHQTHTRCGYWLAVASRPENMLGMDGDP